MARSLTPWTKFDDDPYGVAGNHRNICKPALLLPGAEISCSGKFAERTSHG
jgi:hypothetical protein